MSQQLFKGALNKLHNSTVDLWTVDEGNTATGCLLRETPHGEILVEEKKKNAHGILLNMKNVRV